jgi:hypothetical protein
VGDTVIEATSQITTTICNAAALPLIVLAVALRAVAERLAWLSKVIGDGAAKLMGPEA